MKNFYAKYLGSLKSVVTDRLDQNQPQTAFDFHADYSRFSGAPFSCDAFFNPGRRVTYSTIAGKWFDGLEVQPRFSGTLKNYVVALRTYYGYYLNAVNGGGGAVDARASSNPAIVQQTNQEFVLTDLNGGTLNTGDQVQLQAKNGMYVVAEGGGGGVVNANRTSGAQWETFTIYRLDSAHNIIYGPISRNNLVAFRSYYGYWIVAEAGGNSDVNCNRTNAAEWETFTLQSPNM